jgi:nitrite reductase (NO-forming)
MSGTSPTTARLFPSWPKDAVRISFGVIWLIDAILKWLPGFRSGYMSTIMGQADGQPGWLKGWFTFWINLQHPQATFFAYLVAVVETLIAVAVIAGFARKVTYISAVAFSVLIWATAEGFGGPYTSGSADIGTAVIYAMVFLGLLALSGYTGPARYSADYYLEKRISWWWKIAEIRRPAQDVPAPAGAAITAEPTASPAVVPQPRTAQPATSAPAVTAGPAASDGQVPAGRPLA